MLRVLDPYRRVRRARYPVIMENCGTYVAKGLSSPVKATIKKYAPKLVSKSHSLASNSPEGPCKPTQYMAFQTGDTTNGQTRISLRLTWVAGLTVVYA